MIKFWDFDPIQTLFTRNPVKRISIATVYSARVPPMLNIHHFEQNYLVLIIESIWNAVYEWTGISWQPKNLLKSAERKMSGAFYKFTCMCPAV